MEYPESIKTYFSAHEQWMLYFGFKNPGVEPNWLFDKCYIRDAVQASKFAKVNTFCFLKFYNQPFNAGAIQQFSSECFNYANKYRQGYPLGFGGSLVVYPCLIVEKISQEFVSFIRNYLSKHYASFEFPGILDISTGNLYFYPRTPMWGALYYNGFKKEINELFSPVVWKMISEKK